MALDDFRRETRVLTTANDELNRPVVIKQDDVSGRTLRIQITDGGTVVDMTGMQVFLCWSHETLQWKGIEAFSPIDASTGVFELAYPQSMQYAGTLNAYISIVNGNQIVNTINFKILVQDDLGIQASLEYEGQMFTSLKQLIADFTKLTESAQGTIDDYASALESHKQAHASQMTQQQTTFTSQLETQQSTFTNQLNEQKSRFDDLMDNIEAVTGVVAIGQSEIDGLFTSLLSNAMTLDEPRDNNDNDSAYLTPEQVEDVYGRNDD